MTLPFWLMFGLLLKHLIVDFPMQTAYQYKNKGTFGHPGGLLHSGLHAVGTLIVLMLCGSAHLWLAALDGVAHYFTDYGKMRVNAFAGWTPTNSEKFWWLLGLDQWAHQMTYLLIAVVT